MSGRAMFAEWIKSSGYRKGHVSGLIGCSAPSLSGWLNGHREPMPVFRDAIEKVTGGAVPASVAWGVK